MSTTLTCRSCADAFEPPADVSAQAEICPRCREQAELFARQVLSGFKGELRPRPPTLFYRLGIVLVAVMMVLLPLAYLGLIAGVAYMLYLHATQWGPAMFSEAQAGRGGRGGKQAVALLLMYVGPLLAGAVLVLFMLKPLLAARPAARRSRALDPLAEPLLFDFVARLCRKVGAPLPKQIEIDCDVNASAGFRRGWISLLGNDLVLTIGAPLVAGLSVRQFAGVLAHEFGHFAQGAGMRVTYVIRSVNAWFSRVVNERDAWDEQLVAWTDAPIRELQVVVLFTRFLVWLTRRILWVLMYVGHAISCFMLRQMEFDADRFAAWFAGSAAFEETMQRVELVSVAWRGVIVDLQNSFTEGQLADDTNELLLVNLQQITPEIIEKIQTAHQAEKTSWFDTHPALSDRIASAAKEQAPGIFQVEGRTADLFQDFPKLSREVTQDFYRDSLGDRFRTAKLVPVSQILSRQRADAEGHAAYGRYFGATFRFLRPLALTSGASQVVDLPNIARAITELREAIAQGTENYNQLLAEYDAADTRWIEADQAAALIAGGLSVKPADFHLKHSTAIAAKEAKEWAQARQQALVPALEEYEQSVERRLNLALSLLTNPEITANLSEAPRWHVEATALCSTARDLAHAWPQVLELRNIHASLSLMLNNLQGREEQAEFINAIRSVMKETARQLSELHQSLQPVLYPFEHAICDVSVAHYALEQLPPPDNLGEIYSASATVLQQLHLLLTRTASRLAIIAESIEQALPPQ